MKITTGTKVLITGAASGIGRATTLALGARGACVCITDINEAGLIETKALVEAAGGTVGACVVCDISDHVAVQALAATIHQAHGALEILINNAGIALFALIEDMSHDDWRRIINTDLWGPIHGIECFLPEMIRAKRGHVVNVSSTAGLVGAPWHAAYSTAKWGLVGLSEVLHFDLAQHNIQVTVVCPGAVDTPIKHSVRILGVDKESAVVQQTMRRFERHAVTPEHVAGLIVDAIERKRFLVITSFDIKALYFFKRLCFPIYHLIVSRISGYLNSMKQR